MLDVVRLLLPALFPSWRFFDVIAPSPRIEVALFSDAGDEGGDWRDCRPRPERVDLRHCLTSLFWNARWNETLYLATCAERLMQNPTEHSSREIRRRLRADLLRADRLRETGGAPEGPLFRFRLVFVSRENGGLRRDVAFVSPLYPIVDPLEP